MSVVVPRWEWRGFGETVRDVESTFSRLTPERLQESDEIYLLSVEGTDAVKVRAGLMDVKHLVEVSDDGLEQWVPVMKAGFPLSADDVDVLFDALRVDAPRSFDGRRGWRDFLDEVVRPHADLRAVEVHKTRVRYTIGGCMAELTNVRTKRASTRTVAIESEDPSLVIATLREVGLPARPNVSFARGLKALVRFGVERYAVVDVGTNSVKFHVAERTSKNEWRPIVDRAQTTRLGDGLQQTGRLNPDPMERTHEAIRAMAEEARGHEVAAITAVGTAGLRMASNGADFVKDVQERSGVKIDIISGEEEGRLAYLATMAGLGPAPGSVVVFDTGGGSSQFTFGAGDRVEERFSLEVGAVRYTERYHLDGVVSSDVLAEVLAALEADLVRLDGRPAPDALIAMGGAVTNLAAVKHGLVEYDPEVVQGTVLDRAEVDRQIELYRALDTEERRTIAGLQPARAEVILAGACIVRTVLDKLGTQSLTVSDRGLRHGVLVERFG